MSTSATTSPITFGFRFEFPDGNARDFELRLDPQTLHLITEEAPSYPKWTELTCCQCPHCPLSAEEHSHCPIARNIVVRKTV